MRAHSWIEQLSNVASDGSYIGAFGYPRNFADKGAPGYDQNHDKWLLPEQGQRISHVDRLCHPGQRDRQQSPNWPRLKSIRNATVAMRYAEGGHVTIPNGGLDLVGKPELGGTVFVFGTSQPRTDTEELLLDVLQWTQDGQGGDKRGRLLASQNFDDGRCYQLGNAAMSKERMAKTPDPAPGQQGGNMALLCETDVLLPKDISIGLYTLYWVWQWPTAPNKDQRIPNGEDEYYVSCIDIDIVDSISLSRGGPALAQQDSMSSAVDNFSNRGSLTTDPLALYKPAPTPV